MSKLKVTVIGITDREASRLQRCLAKQGCPAKVRALDKGNRPRKLSGIVVHVLGSGSSHTWSETVPNGVMSNRSVSSMLAAVNGQLSRSA